MKKIYSLLLLGSLAAAGLTSCSDDDGPVKKSANAVLGIPLDSEATEAPEITQPTVVLPNPQLALQEYEGYEYLQIEMTGIWDEISSSYLTLTGTRDDDQNVWVTVDDTPKGIAINNLKDDTSARLLVDVVFLVDNSGSMGEEANTVANSIIKWSNMLAESGLDLNVGCVGYGDAIHAIDGAINLTTPEKLTTYLQKGTGTSRTHYYGGDDANTLKSIAEGGKYENGAYFECGMVALRFAHDNFNFRPAANRVYVNFTDEPNQPNGYSKWSVEYLNPENGNWKSNYGTIHTVYSASKFSYNDVNSTEQPWLMSEYTGGSYIFVSSNASDWDLTSLPVTGAMQNSSQIRLTNLEHLKDGNSHRVKITVHSTNGHVKGEKIVNFNFSEGKEE